MKKNKVQSVFEDDTCEVWCPCGKDLFISSEQIYRCPNCRRGYRVDFVVYCYEDGEQDKRYKDAEPIRVSDHEANWGVKK